MLCCSKFLKQWVAKLNSFREENLVLFQILQGENDETDEGGDVSAELVMAAGGGRRLVRVVTRALGALRALGPCDGASNEGSRRLHAWRKPQQLYNHGEEGPY